MRDPLVHPPNETYRPPVSPAPKGLETPMTTPAKKIPAKKIPAKQAPKRQLKEKVTPATITASDAGLRAIMRHMSKDHRLTKAEVQQKMGMNDSPDFDRLWDEGGL